MAAAIAVAVDVTGRSHYLLTAVAAADQSLHRQTPAAAADQSLRMWKTAAVAGLIRRLLTTAAAAATDPGRNQEICRAMMNLWDVPARIPCRE